MRSSSAILAAEPQPATVPVTSLGECIACSAVLGFEGANEREGLRRDAQARLRPEIEGLRAT